jgi:hypothetical protein
MVWSVALKRERDSTPSLLVRGSAGADVPFSCRATRLIYALRLISIPLMGGEREAGPCQFYDTCVHLHVECCSSARPRSPVGRNAWMMPI